jgi:transcriptional regulator with XRE-family HTH domain
MNADFMLSTAPEVCLALGERLRAQRLAQNLQQAELAQRAGVSKLTILNLENKGAVTLQSFIQVVRALGLVDELLPLFALQPKSIALMEAADAASKRVRASRRRKPAP